jgi:hypothetical protein
LWKAGLFRPACFGFEAIKATFNWKWRRFPALRSGVRPPEKGGSSEIAPSGVLRENKNHHRPFRQPLGRIILKGPRQKHENRLTQRFFAVSFPLRSAGWKQNRALRLRSANSESAARTGELSAGFPNAPSGRPVERFFGSGGGSVAGRALFQKGAVQRGCFSDPEMLNN